MKKKLLIANRLIFTIALIALQVGSAIVVFQQYAGNLPTVFWAVLYAVQAVAAVNIVGRQSHPAYRALWLATVILLPVIGISLYAFWGNCHKSKELQANIMEMEAALEGMETDISAKNAAQEYLLHSANAPIYANTDARYFPVGEAMYASMLQDLESAEEFIFMEYFIIEDGKMWSGLLDVLKRKAAQGVEVRLMYDDMGSLLLMPPGYAREMEALGIQCLCFNPIKPVLTGVMNNRDHRKIMVIDGKVGYSGGINIADEYINHVEKHGHWKDNGIRLEGEGVWGYTKLFLSLWNAVREQDREFSQYKSDHKVETVGYVQPYGVSPLSGEPVGQSAYLHMIQNAEKYVYIFTPYLIIDKAMRAALTDAAQRGVDVRIATPGIPDKKLVYRLTRANYTPLLKKGVRVYEYTPGFLHAKTMVCDDRYAVVGTINFDYRSLFLHFECATLMADTPCVQDILSDARQVFRASEEITRPYKAHSIGDVIVDTLLKTAAPLF